MSRVIVGMILVPVLYAQAFAQGYVSGTERDKVIADTKAGCVGDYNKDPAFSLIPVAVGNYCGCVATGLADILTKAEVESGKTTRSMETRIKAVGEKCIHFLKEGLEQAIQKKQKEKQKR